MSPLALLVVLLVLHLQEATCFKGCLSNGLRVSCAGQRLKQVPTLWPNITHLYLETNHIGEINSTSLRDYPELLDLDLGNQRVPLVIRNDAFLYQTKLIRLVLGNNLGLQLELRSFAGMSNLQILYLDRCGLRDSFLMERFLQPLLSLESLNLFGNNIENLRPGLFFFRLRRLTQLDLKLNQIKQLCESDLLGFRGKSFSYLNLSSNHLFKMCDGDLNWTRCGKPFRGMTFQILDLTSNGFNSTGAEEFFNLMDGAQIIELKFSANMGKGFAFNNNPDPEKRTFKGLNNSFVDYMNLSGNRIFALQEAVFSHLRNTRIIDVSLNKINLIEDGAFDGLQGHLRMLNLSFNLLGEVYDSTFENLTDLRVLDLSYNNIGQLGPNSFEGLPYLRGLYLTGNSLRDLGFPASLPNLDYLLLGDNRLKSLYNVAAWGSAAIHLDVTDNRLTNLQDVYSIIRHFKFLQNFFYGGNFIRWCALGSDDVIPRNGTLEVLDLHSSSLGIIWSQRVCLDLFDNLDSVLGLNLSFNALTVLPPGIFRGLSSIIQLDLSSNSLTYLQRDVFPRHLEMLIISNNFLAAPDPETFRSLVFIDLAKNRFHCNCELEPFLAWLNETNVTSMSPLEDMRCEFPAELNNVPLPDYSVVVEPCVEDEEEDVRELQFALFVFSSVLIISMILSGMVHARLRGHIYIIYKKMVGRVLEGPKHAPELEDLQYDAYLCFSNNDYQWVETALLKKLDKGFAEENLLRCCFEARDFLPGEDHLSNIREAIWASKKTVCVVSKEFLNDGWCLDAFTLAQGRMLEELTNVLIMLVVGKVRHYQLMRFAAMRAFVQKREYLVWPEDPQDLDWFYERLFSRILKEKKLQKVEGGEAEPGIEAQNQDGIQLEDLRAN
ncbi:toll-like receptor 5b [Neosynchiropus ocellatus]